LAVIVPQIVASTPLARTVTFGRPVRVRRRALGNGN